MYLTVKQNFKHLSKIDYNTLRELCRFTKNLTNQAIYEIRQELFQNKKYLPYIDVYNILKTSENFEMLQHNVAQQTLRKVDSIFKTYFSLIKAKKANKIDCRIGFPRYLPKDGYSEIIIQTIRINNGKVKVPVSHEFGKTHQKVYFKVPPFIVNKNIKEIHIIPRCNARYFDIEYIYEVDEATTKVELDNQKALAIDPGVDNFCTCVTSNGKSFIIDGRKLKSINQWFNTEHAILQTITDKQKHKGQTNKQAKLSRKRSNQIRDYLNKTGNIIIKYCVKNKIGNIVFGSNKYFQSRTKTNKKNKQNLVSIPFFKLKQKLQYLCKKYGINFVEQEESYTSKASFWDRDEIPTYGNNDFSEYAFSGKRIHRGLYQTADGRTLNADVNGALNILRKSNVVSLEALYSRGELSTPVRIRVA